VSRGKSLAAPAGWLGKPRARHPACVDRTDPRQAALAWGTRRYDPEFRKQYWHRCHSVPKNVAQVAAARRLAVRLYWMLRTQKPHPEIVRIESSLRVPLVGAG